MREREDSDLGRRRVRGTQNGRDILEWIDDGSES